jgi:hypothetical protein
MASWVRTPSSCEVSLSDGLIRGRDPAGLASQHLVYGAITHLMTGDAPPVHAVDSLKTRAS